MIHIPSLCAVWAHEKAIVARAIVSIRARQEWTRLRPARCQTGVTAAIPCEKSQAVVWSPAVASRVRDKSFATVVQGHWSFLHRGAIPLPGLGGLRENLCGTNLTRRCQGGDAERLHAVGHARPGKVVAPVIEAYDRTIYSPFRGQLGEVCVGVERCSATCRCVSTIFDHYWMKPYP